MRVPVQTSLRQRAPQPDCCSRWRPSTSWQVPPGTTWIEVTQQWQPVVVASQSRALAAASEAVAGAPLEAYQVLELGVGRPPGQMSWNRQA
jgi:hypothetical protein